jgi:hypothetical protein
LISQDLMFLSSCLGSALMEVVHARKKWQVTIIGVASPRCRDRGSADVGGRLWLTGTCCLVKEGEKCYSSGSSQHTQATTIIPSSARVLKSLLYQIVKYCGTYFCTLFITSPPKFWSDSSRVLQLKRTNLDLRCGTGVLLAVVEVTMNCATKTPLMQQVLLF